MSRGRAPAGKTHEKRAEGADKHRNIGKQGQARKAARESAEAREREMERTQPELPPEDREIFRGTMPYRRKGR